MKDGLLLLEWSDSLKNAQPIESGQVMDHVMQDLLQSQAEFDSVRFVVHHPYRDGQISHMSGTRSGLEDRLARYRNEKFARCVDRIIRLSNPGNDPEPLIHLNTFYAFAKEPGGKDNFWGADFFELVYAYASSCGSGNHQAMLLMEQVEREAIAYAAKDPKESGILREVFAAVHETCR